MRQRIILGGGVVAVLAILLFWLGSIATPVSAMEQMAESIRKAKSFRAVMIVEGQLTPESGKPPVKHKVTGTIYWLAPGSSRVDFKGSAPNANGGPSAEADVTKIDLPGESQEIIIDHKAKTFSRVRLPKEVPGVDIVAKLGEFSGQADRNLGDKEISGKKAHGFEIDLNKIFKKSNNSNASGQGMVEIWIDTESNLPVFIRFIFNTNLDQKENADSAAQISDFQWNIDLDPKLFDIKPPEGYTDATPKEPTVDYRVRRFTDTLRLYAEWNGGRYPRGLKNVLEAEEASQELLKIFGFKDYSGKAPVDPEQTEKYKKVQWVVGGLHMIAGLIQVINPDAAYYGKAVGPNDKDKVLLRWKLDDGKYAVIYGDLHNETVTAEKLRTLEGK